MVISVDPSASCRYTTKTSAESSSVYEERELAGQRDEERRILDTNNPS